MLRFARGCWMANSGSEICAGTQRRAHTRYSLEPRFLALHQLRSMVFDTPQTLKWLLIGDANSPHFERVRGCLLGRIQQQLATLAGALEWLESGQQVPDGVLVYQSFPDEFAPDHVEQMIGLLPLARWIVCFGPWCESVGRTEQVWPVAWCVPLRDVEPRVAREQAAHRRDDPSWLPTMSRDESFARSATELTRAPRAQGQRVAVQGDDPAFVETVEAILRSQGSVLVAPADADLIFVTTGPLQPDMLPTIAALRAASPSARLIVVSDLLTDSEAAQVRAGGADEVISALRFVEAITVRVTSDVGTATMK